jgi:BioD-like phosphotransacetylase family protein
MKRIYVAATEQHAGKTTISVGLYRAALERGLRTCFIKPVGQRYVMEGEEQVDEDAVLFKRALLAKGNVKDMSPVTIPRGFTREYIFDRNPEAIHRAILEAVESLEAEHDLTIVEGTGHAGVGSVIDSSNAEVARLLDARCLIIAGGGIGRCIDELCLNRALFDRFGVPMIGAIINKVYQEKYDKVGAAVRQGLANHGMDCVGIIPYRQELTYPTMIHIQEEYGLEVLCGGVYLGNTVRDIIVAAMAPQNMIDHLTDGSLVVVPGDRVDNILASITAHLMTERGTAPQIAGLLLTGGFMPHLSIVNILVEVDVPVLLTDDDTATATFKVRSLVPKITARDKGKIALAEQIIAEYVDVDRVFSSVGLAAGTDEKAGADG